ncbi:MAG: S8 family serine peptidase [Promethearchaeota archaeon]|nr:MAG: S8 family serine peptidase [Candidatus Lokiarchaeota archaeon]
MSVYSIFKKKIENYPQNQQLRVIISFEDLSNREKFVQKYKELEILGKFDFIPSIYTTMKKKEIANYEQEILIRQIEEDQRLFLSMLDVIEILELDEYKNSHISYTGKHVNVGIIDDGINKNFESLSKNFKGERGFNKIKYKQKEITHGTIIASIISNQFKDIYDNHIGIAPDVNLIDFNISNPYQEFYFSNILDVVDKIYEEKINIDILLISFSTKEPSDGKDILSLACNLLVDNGLIIVSPAGNFGPKLYTIGSPGAAQKVITIGALTKKLTVPKFSGRGPTLDERSKPDLCLPGFNVIVPLSNHLRVRVIGTSVSASIGVGIIALLKEFNPKISYNEIIDLFRKSRLELNWESTAQGMGTVKISELFKKLELFHEKLIPYSYLIKKSIKVTIEFLILIILLFFLINFFRIA